MIESAQEINFQALKSHTDEQCRQRWHVLVKSSNHYHPGRKLQPSELAEQILEEVEDREEKVAQVAVKKRNNARVVQDNESLIDMIKRLLG